MCKPLGKGRPTAAATLCSCPSACSSSSFGPNRRRLERSCRAPIGLQCATMDYARLGWSHSHMMRPTKPPMPAMLRAFYPSVPNMSKVSSASETAASALQMFPCPAISLALPMEEAGRLNDKSSPSGWTARPLEPSRARKLRAVLFDNKRSNASLESLCSQLRCLLHPAR